MSEQAVAAPKHEHDAHHEELGFWRKYIFSTDHKVIGIQYAVTGTDTKTQNFKFAVPAK